MYGLPQAGILADKLLQSKLAAHGYRPVPVTPGLRKHDTRDLYFAMVVDDFGVKYTRREDVQQHLMTTLQEVGYKVSEDRAGTRYCGLTLTWDYTARTVTITMPGYTGRALQRFQHTAPVRDEHFPHAWLEPAPIRSLSSIFRCARQNFILVGCRQFSPCPRGPRHVIVLCSSSRSHNAQSYRDTCDPVVKTNRSHHGGHCQTAQLCSIPS